MKKSTSVFLDLLRVLAALVVFLTHIVKILYPQTIWIPGHAMVIVFFVLSGYVIAYSTLQRKGMGPRKYAIARLSRLYSVVIPALLLTGVLLIVGRMINPGFYKEIMEGHESLRFAATGLFLQSVWWKNLAPPDNGPFWSLGYEFWYYAIFGLAIFVREWKWKFLFILLCCLVVGVNVLLLFPIWLLGVGLYVYRDSLPLPAWVAVPGFIVITLLTISSIFYLPEYPSRVGFAPLFYSGSFVTDWIMGLGVGLMIWLYKRTGDFFSYPEPAAKAVQWAAGHTFSLYLYHFPLIVFFGALGWFNQLIWWQAAIEIALILAIIIALSELTESKRDLWKKAIESICASLSAQPQLAPAATAPSSPEQRPG